MSDDETSRPGNYMGITRPRNLYARIQLSGAAITATQEQGEAFTRAMAQEYTNATNAWAQWERNRLYLSGQQWVKFYGDSLDPDMEMDIGL